MITELGHLALIVAFVIAIAQSVLPFWGAQKNSLVLMEIGRSAAITHFFLVTASFAALIYAFLVSDFSVKLAWQHSHSLQPTIYKVTGVWGNHEGSMLLWALILALFAALVAQFGKNLPHKLMANVMAVHGWLSVAFVGFILFTSNPFARLDNPPLEGRDLNPILQDIGLAIHPPLLYVGYVGFATTFAFALAALIEGRIDAAWARWVRPWTLVAWVFLTAGIAMGSYWAYYELGWGGWWFWDPVENASFMPWLSGTALLHSALVMERRDALKIWTILLAILTFSLSLLGTFLVRSGILTSVHSFASDPSRGIIILGILMLFIGGGLALFALRAHRLKVGGIFAPISREGALVLNNLFLTVGCAAVLVGTLYPLALEMINGQKISVGTPFFNFSFVPLMLPLLIAVPFGAFLPWKRGDIVAVLQRLWAAAAAAVLVSVVGYGWTYQEPTLAVLGLGLAAWLIVGAASEFIWRAGLGRQPIKTVIRRAIHLPGSAWGTMLAHSGLGVMVIGIVAATSWNYEIIRSVKPGGSLEIAGYEVTFKSIEKGRFANYTQRVAVLAVSKDGDEVTILTPGTRTYRAQRNITTEAGIYTTGFSQLYLSLGEVEDDGSIALSAYYKPLVTLIWLGCLVMSIGGLVSLADRRFRIGAPRPSKKKLAMAGAMS